MTIVMVILIASKLLRYTMILYNVILEIRFTKKNDEADTTTLMHI